MLTNKKRKLSQVLARSIGVFLAIFWIYTAWVEQNLLYLFPVLPFLAIMWGLGKDEPTHETVHIKWSWIEYIGIGFGPLVFVPLIYSVQSLIFPENADIINIMLGIILGLTTYSNVSYIVFYRIRCERFIRSAILAKIYDDPNISYDTDTNMLVEKEYQKWKKVRMSAARKILLIKAGVPAEEARKAKNLTNNDIDVWGSFAKYSKDNP